MSGLPEGWIDAVMEDVADIQLGKMLDKTKNKGDPTPYLRNINVRWGSFDLSDVLEMRFTREERGFFSIEDNDLIVCEGGEPGRAAIWRAGPTVLKYQKALHRVRLSEWVIPDFVYYFLRHASKQGLLESFLTGTTIKHLPRNAFLRFKLPLPPTNEQRRIVAKLDSLFERTRHAREELSHIPRLIENYKNAILEAAFRGDLTRDWRSRSFARDPVFPRDADAIKKKYRGSSELAFSPPYTIPNEWRWFRLPELGELDRGKSKHRPRNDPTLYGGDFPFVQTGEVREATRYLRYYSKTYNDKGLSQSRLWSVGTVCITIAANIAETAILDIDACFPDSVVGFIADKDRVSNSYIEFFLRTMKDDLEAFAPATAQKNINLDTLSSAYVPVPPLNEQIEIVNRIEKAMDWLEIVAEEQGHSMHLLDRLDQANLAKAFRGELVPQDPNDEPASVLLERICAARAQQPKNTRKGRGKTANARVAA